jgi:choline dehydrogenase-like flavoprotein
MKRRDLIKAGLAAGGLIASQTVAARESVGRAESDLSGDPPRGGPSGPSATRLRQAAPASAGDRLEAEFIVVGSGAGGGTVAARLAEEGHTVIVLEAGGDPKGFGPDTAADYDVPAFHPFATENADVRWDFFVRHYASEQQQSRDKKYKDTWNGRKVDGVFYPRTGTLGGCTAHNAMILVYPHDWDWNQVADLTGDPSWRADQMRAYFEKIENCHHRGVERALSTVGINPSRHGYSGWLHTERGAPLNALVDKGLRTVLLESARAALRDEEKRSQFRFGKLSDDEGDPNDYRVTLENGIGLRYTPLTTKNHARIGTRERLLDVRKRYPDRLRIQMNALATRVIFDAQNRAIGVEFLEGERLYRAHAQPSTSSGVVRQAYATREVILAGGAFNTPQLLMLSGIGDPGHLSQHGITPRVALPGVGRNLQDRYEVGVVNRMTETWKILRGATFRRGDSVYNDWERKRQGAYVTNGSLLSVVLRSSVNHPVPDLFCYALLAKFPGYEPGYSEVLRENLNYLTWVVLKGHTNNTAGTVMLRSPDPRDPPLVNFHYFQEGNDASEADLDAVVNGVNFVRKMTAPLKQDGQTKLIEKEELPGDDVQTPDEIKQFVRNQAWGHHASCSCQIGDPQRGGVVASDFTVHGTQGLRVVDASVFPRVPGLFIVSAVYMIGEKAADVILAEARAGARTSAKRV